MPAFIQINTNRSKESMDLAVATAIKMKASMILASEPNKRKVVSRRWHKDIRKDAAIMELDCGREITDAGGGTGYVWVTTRGLRVYSCYISPNIDLEEFEARIQEIIDDISARRGERIVLTGDFNAKSPMWGLEVEDRRGEMLSDALASLGMVALNEPGAYTFARGTSRSAIDITIVSENVLRDGCRWRVQVDEEPLSPHKYIYFEIGGTSRAPGRWVYAPVDAPRLADELERLVTANAEITYDRLDSIVGTAYRATTGKVRATAGKMPYWWTAEISALRDTAKACRRRHTRARRGVASEEQVHETADAYREARSALCRAIKTAKRTAWRTMIDSVDGDLFGLGYRIVTKTLGLEFTPPITADKKRELIDRLFPEAPAALWERENTNDCPPFTLEELVTAAGRLKIKKAPGPDGVPAEAVKVAVGRIGQYMLDVFNGLLAQGSFPLPWKTSKLVLVDKPRKNPEAEVTYRPTCLVNSVAKLYEQLINTRVVAHLDRAQVLYGRQYGFRKGRTSVDAMEDVMRIAKNAHRSSPSRWCVVALLDIRNAFNTANWEEIIHAVMASDVPPYLRNVVRGYLSHRFINIGKGRLHETNVGVPQGSVLGPTLWNLMYDGVFRIETDDMITPIGYADDIDICCEHRAWPEALRRMENHVTKIGDWLRQKGLALAPEKTEVIALRFGRPDRGGSLNVEEAEIPVGTRVKYLGVVLDSAVSFGPHVRAVASKAERTANKICSLMPNIGGPSEGKRRILATICDSVMLYGAPVWAAAMKVKTYRQVLQRVQRRVALRVCRGYRTVSYEAAAVLAAVVPVHLLATERERVWRLQDRSAVAKRQERARTLRAWEEEWDASDKGRWTHRLIGEVAVWLGRRHGTSDYFMTQWLTGHGSFGTYKKRIGKSQDDMCGVCRVQDSPEHVMFECRRWAEERNALNAEVGVNLTTDNVINIMLQSDVNWTRIAALIRKIVMTKEVEGRG